MLIRKRSKIYPIYKCISRRDVVFKPEELENFFQDEKVYLWGYYDGSGEEINLTPAEYYESFIYTADFANPKKLAITRY